MPTQTLIEHCLADKYQIYCFESVMLIIWKIEEKFSDGHFPSKSAAPARETLRVLMGNAEREHVERVLNYLDSRMYVCCRKVFNP